MLILIQMEKVERRKRKKIKDIVQSMIPNIIFNPSIAIPQGAPINRPEVNPPVFLYE